MLFLRLLKKYYKYIFEGTLILFIIIFSIIRSEEFLRDWHGPGGSITTDLYIPSILFACGKGFVNASPSEIPHLRAFLDFNEPHFSAEHIPEDIQYQELDVYQQYHRYLIYIVGIVWHLFGVSWEVLRWFLVIVYAITVLIIYAIARIFLPSIFSFFVSIFFVISLIPIIILPILRDFLRAPFILLVILILFHLIRGIKTNKQYLFYCVFLGFTCGIGIGFRRDLLIFFVLSVLVLFIVPKQNNIPKISVRLGSIKLLIIAFLISSYPILKSFHQFGTLGWHDTLMGFATEHDDLAGLQRTNYERIPKYNDLFVSANADVYCYYNESLNDYELYNKKNPELEKQKLLFAYLYWFPADMVIRTYSAIARISDRILSSALPINPYRSLLSLAIIILFIAIDFRRGLCFAIVLLFSMSIQTLQFSFRHSFYLTFIPSLLYFLLLTWLLIGTYHLWQGGKEKIVENRDKLTHIVKRFIIIAFTITFFALGILIVARQIQSYQLSRLFQAYHTAEQIPLSYKTLATERGTVYSLDKPLSPRWEKIFTADASYTANILVIDFVVHQFPACFEAIYDGINDFSYNLTITRFMLSENNSSEYVRYFIPVYENMQDLKSNWNRFIGIRIEDTDKLQVVGIYKICNLDKIPLFINYYFVKDEVPGLYQKIAPYSKSQINPCWKPYGISPSQAIVNNAIGAFYSGEKKKAYEILKKAMQEEPYYLKYGLALADLYETAGETDNAKQVYTQLISHRLHDAIPAMKLKTLLSRLHFTPEAQQQFWENMTKQVPESSVVWLCNAQNQPDSSTARESLAKAVHLNNDILLSIPFTSVYYNMKDIFSQVMKDKTTEDNSLCTAISLREQISYMLTAGMYLSEHNDYQKALDILQFLVKITPQFYLIYPPLISTLIKQQNTDLETVFYYNTTLISLIPYKPGPIIQMEEIQENTHYLSEQEWVDIWNKLENRIPDSPCILCGLGRAYEIAQQKTEAEQAYRKAIRYARKSDECTQLAYYRLVKLLYQSGQKNEAIITLNKSIRLYPNNPILKTLLEKLNNL